MCTGQFPYSFNVRALPLAPLCCYQTASIQVSKTGLEQVRKLKARQQRLTIRTQTMRDELERFLEDDNDLHKFCLTYKKQVEDMAKAERQRSLQAPDTGAAVGSQAPVGSMARYGALRGMMAGVQGTSPPHQWSGGDLAGMVSMRHSKSLGPGPFSGPGINPFGMDDSIVEATEDVENLLESYYMSIDNAYDKLISLGMCMMNGFIRFFISSTQMSISRTRRNSLTLIWIGTETG